MVRKAKENQVKAKIESAGKRDVSETSFMTKLADATKVIERRTSKSELKIYRVIFQGRALFDDGRVHVDLVANNITDAIRKAMKKRKGQKFNRLTDVVAATLVMKVEI